MIHIIVTNKQIIKWIIGGNAFLGGRGRGGNAIRRQFFDGRRFSFFGGNDFGGGGKIKIWR